MGVSTYVVRSGPLAPLRAAVFEQQDVVAGEMPPAIAHVLGGAIGVSAHWVSMAVGMCLIGFAAASRAVWDKPMHVFWSLVVGTGAIIGWAGTAWVARDGFEALSVVSHSFAAPMGETILWWMTGSARPLSFAVGSITGVWTGAFVGSLIKGHFRWEACEDPRELRRQIFGAVLMGVGAVTALGCSIGQGLSAFSVLALSAPVTFAAIFSGAARLNSQGRRLLRLGHFLQAGDVARQRVDFQIDAIPSLGMAPGGHGFRVGDKVDAELAVIDLVHRERGAIQRDGAFGRDVAGQFTRGAQGDARAVALAAHLHDLGHAIHMARHDMAAQFIPDLERPLKVQGAAHTPQIEIGFRHGFGADFHVKPIITKRHNRQADPVTGDRSANIDAAGVIARADPRAEIAALLKRLDFPDIGDDSREHGLSFRRDIRRSPRGLNFVGLWR